MGINVNHMDARTMGQPGGFFQSLTDSMNQGISAWSRTKDREGERNHNVRMLEIATDKEQRQGEQAGADRKRKQMLEDLGITKDTGVIPQGHEDDPIFLRAAELAGQRQQEDVNLSSARLNEANAGAQRHINAGMGQAYGMLRQGLGMAPVGKRGSADPKEVDGVMRSQKAWTQAIANAVRRSPEDNPGEVQKQAMQEYARMRAADPTLIDFNDAPPASADGSPASGPEAGVTEHNMQQFPEDASIYAPRLMNEMGLKTEPFSPARSTQPMPMMMGEMDPSRLPQVDPSKIYTSRAPQTMSADMVPDTRGPEGQVAGRGGNANGLKVIDFKKVQARASDLVHVGGITQAEFDSLMKALSSQNSAVAAAADDRLNAIELEFANAGSVR